MVLNNSFRTPIGARDVVVVLVALVLVWSGIEPHDRLTWILECFWVIGAIIGWFGWWRSKPCTPLLFGLLILHALFLIIGGKYTYELVPLGEWMRDFLGRPRNDYDRVGHFLQGFVPAILAREIFLREAVIAKRGWRVLTILAYCLAFSAAFELLEFIAALSFGEDASQYLAMQGDVWDTQWDMAACILGAITAIALLSREHNREFNRELKRELKRELNLGVHAQ
ncbi:MAG: DUF2238 domain-containing protein [Phycisphaerales bacterium]|nr:DUF2238 domain-containing protein [Phycisphaerales bacterium]